MSLNGQLGAAQLGALPLAGWRKEASGSGLLSAAAQLGALPLFLSGFALLRGSGLAMTLDAKDECERFINSLQLARSKTSC